MSDELIPAGASPLGEPDPNSLNTLIAERVNEIFNKAPLSLEDDELDLMIAYYQKERTRFKLESELKEQRPRATATKRKAPESVAEALTIATLDMI